MPVKNEVGTIDNPNWPKRMITRIESVPNTYDNHGPAYKVTLACDHWCILTGTAVNDRSTVACKMCAREGKV